MNILFVLYGDFTSNSANPLALYTRELTNLGYSCVVAVPTNLETVDLIDNPAFTPILYRDVIAEPDTIFSDGRPADVIHACTPREVVRKFVMSYMFIRPTPLVIYLEDNESWISKRALGYDDDSMVHLTDEEISKRLPDTLTHPTYGNSFIGLADVVVIIQEKLKIFVPAWVQYETVMLGVDLEFFTPRPATISSREKYDIAEDEKVIVYHGGLNEFTRPGIETLCRAVGILNKRGYPCRLLRSGPFPLDFLESLPYEAVSSVNDLGLLAKKELPNLLALADVFVQPGKINSFEDLRLPGKVPEYLAMGRPVIMPDVNIADLFNDGESVILLKSGNEDEIADKCIELFLDTKKTGNIGIAGRKLAEKYFDVKKQGIRLAEVYEQARKIFNLSFSNKIWQSNDKTLSISSLLARKLNILAEVDPSNRIFNIHPNEMLLEYSKYIDKVQRRILELEGRIKEEIHEVSERNHVIAKRDQEIAKRDQEIAKRDQEITEYDEIITNQELVIKEQNEYINSLLSSSSWRIMAPVRFIVDQIKKAKHAPIKAQFQNETKLKKEKTFNYRDYSLWVNQYDTISDKLKSIITEDIEKMDKQPLISVIMPTYNSNHEWLDEAISSVRSQIYTKWELCIADDASTDNNIKLLLTKYAELDSRIKVIFREVNGHISAASNDALGIATGDYVALLDHDDLLTEHALYWVADAINKTPNAGIIYSDEDKVDQYGQRQSPYFKSDWNYDLFISHNLITHLGVYNRLLLNKIGGFREGYEGAQDYDLAIRCIEKLKPHQIIHIPRILYHWRIHEESTSADISTKSYAHEAGLKAIKEHLLRSKVSADVASLPTGYYRVQYRLPESAPLTSLIIPTRNKLNLIRQCIDSIRCKTDYRNYEIIIVDNGSDESEVLSYFHSLKGIENIRIIRNDTPFNFSTLINEGIKEARGELVGLINNDIEVIEPGWLTEMVSISCQPGVGVVGARLWFPDNTLQHGGVILGVGGIAGHSHKFLKKDETGYFGRGALLQSFSAVTAACMVMQKHIFHEAGGFNEEKLAVAFNDVDFCLKVRELGYRIVWTPYAELYHHESASRGKEDTVEKQNRVTSEVIYMQQTWGDLLVNDPAYNPNLTLKEEDFSFAWPPRVTFEVHGQNK